MVSFILAAQIGSRPFCYTPPCWCPPAAQMPRKPLDPAEARKVSQQCAKLLAGPQSLSAQNAAVKLAKQLAICPAAAAEVRRAGGVRRLQARPPRPARRARAQSHGMLRPLFRRSCAAWPLSHSCLSQAIAVFGEDGDGELAQLCARDAAQTALRLMGESTTPPVGDSIPAPPKEPWGVPRPQPRPPSPAPIVVLGRTRAARSRSSPLSTATDRKPAWSRPSLHPLPPERPKRRTP